MFFKTAAWCEKMLMSELGVIKGRERVHSSGMSSVKNLIKQAEAQVLSEVGQLPVDGPLSFLKSIAISSSGNNDPRIIYPPLLSAMCSWWS